MTISFCLILSHCAEKQGEVVSSYNSVPLAKKAPSWFVSPPQKRHGVGVAYKFDGISTEEVYKIAFQRAVRDLNSSYKSFIRFEEFYVNQKRYVDAEVGIDFVHTSDEVLPIDSVKLGQVVYYMVSPNDINIIRKIVDYERDKSPIDFGLNKTIANGTHMFGYGKYVEQYNFEVNKAWTVAKQRSLFAIAEKHNLKLRSMVEQYNYTNSEIDEEIVDVERLIHKKSLVAFIEPKVISRWKYGESYYTIVQIDKNNVVISEDNL